MAKKTSEQLIEELASAVKHGFDETASKKDLEALATKEQLQLVADNLDLVCADIHDIKLTLGPLVRMVAQMEGVLRNHDKRIERLEKRIGSAK